MFSDYNDSVDACTSAWDDFVSDIKWEIKTCSRD
jgi:hypothetical protein